MENQNNDEDYVSEGVSSNNGSSGDPTLGAEPRALKKRHVSKKKNRRHHKNQLQDDTMAMRQGRSQIGMSQAGMTSEAGVPYGRQAQVGMDQQGGMTPQEAMPQYSGLPQGGMPQGGMVQHGVMPPQHGMPQYSGLPQGGMGQHAGVPQHHGMPQYSGLPYNGMPQGGMGQHGGMPPQHGMPHYPGMQDIGRAQGGMPQRAGVPLGTMPQPGFLMSHYPTAGGMYPNQMAYSPHPASFPNHQTVGMPPQQMGYYNNYRNQTMGLDLEMAQIREQLISLENRVRHGTFFGQQIPTSSLRDHQLQAPQFNPNFQLGYGPNQPVPLKPGNVGVSNPSSANYGLPQQNQETRSSPDFSNMRSSAKTASKPKHSKKKRTKKMKTRSKSSCKPMLPFSGSDSSSDDEKDGGGSSPESTPSAIKRVKTNTQDVGTIRTNQNGNSGEGKSENVQFGGTEHDVQSTQGVELGQQSKAPGEEGDDAEFKKHAGFYQAGRINNVWANVVASERMAEVAAKMDVVTVQDKFVIQRGPESYTVGNKRKRPHPDDNPGANLETGNSDQDYATDSSLSSGYLSDRALQRLKEAKMRKKVNEANLAKEKDRYTGRQIVEEKMATLEDENLPFYIAKKLHERQGKFYLFVRTMKIFGREFILKTYRNTMKIERLGGIMVKSQKRRRTPGGVFIHLVKTNEALPLADRELIFQADKDEKKEAILADKAYQKKLLLMQTMAAVAFGENNTADVEMNEAEAKDVIDVNGEKSVVQKEKIMDLDRDMDGTTEEDEEESSYQIPPGKTLLLNLPTGFGKSTNPTEISNSISQRTLISYEDIDTGKGMLPNKPFVVDVDYGGY